MIYKNKQKEENHKVNLIKEAPNLAVRANGLRSLQEDRVLRATGAVREDESSKRVLRMERDGVHQSHARCIGGLQKTRFDFTPDNTWDSILNSSEHLFQISRSVAYTRVGIE